MNKNQIILLITIVLIPIFYIGSYFALVDSERFGGTVNEFQVTKYPYYIGGIPKELFSPIHYLDRFYFRPDKWEYSLFKVKDGRIEIIKR